MYDIAAVFTWYTDRRAISMNKFLSAAVSYEFLPAKLQTR